MGCQKNDILEEKNYLNSSLNNIGELNNVAKFSSQEIFLKEIESFKNTGILPVELNGIISIKKANLLKSSQTNTIDITQKEKNKALWKTCKKLGKLTVDLDKNNSKNKREAIRLIPKKSVVTSTEITFAPYREKKLSTDKFTMIIAQNSGGVIGLNLNNYSSLGWGGFTNLSAKYSFLKGSNLYGAARRDNTWRGVRINFK